MSCAYSDSYPDARSRFRAAARNIGAELEAQLVQGAPDSNQNLTIDIARVGAPNPAWSVIVSSGLHGVEGFMGSAIQISSLEQLSVSNLVESGGEFIFIHAINPFGFHELRRVNEDNVDLNRNFLLTGEHYQGTSAEYENLNDLLNPSSPPRLLDPYLVKLGWRIARIGFPALKQAVAEGQFFYPNGLFFGGHKPARSTQIIKDNIMRWPRGGHIVRQLFGADIELVGIGGGLGYDVRGDLGRWATAIARPRYRFLFVEFGTYSPIRILDALRRENQVHFFASANDGACRRAKLALLECFCPSSPSWRAAVLRAGLEVIEVARQGAARA